MVVVDTQSQTVEALSAGARLRAKREAMGLSVDDVAAKLRMPKEVIAALEDMSTEGMSDSIARMRATNYANFLELPAGEIADGYAKSKVIVEVERLPDVKIDTGPSLVQRLSVPIIAAAGIVLVGVLGVIGLSANGPETAELPVYRQVATTERVSDTRASMTALATREEFSIRAIDAGWIEARGSDGTVFRNRMMSKGEVYYPRVDASWTVTLKNAGAFEWWLGEQRIGPVGAFGESIYSVSIDQALSEGEAALKTALAAQTEQAASGR